MGPCRRNPAAHAVSSDTCSAFVRSISVGAPTSLLSAGTVGDRFWFQAACADASLAG